MAVGTIAKPSKILVVTFLFLFSNLCVFMDSRISRFEIPVVIVLTNTKGTKRGHNRTQNHKDEREFLRVNLVMMVQQLSSNGY